MVGEHLARMSKCPSTGLDHSSAVQMLVNNLPIERMHQSALSRPNAGFDGSGLHFVNTIFKRSGDVTWVLPPPSVPDASVKDPQVRGLLKLICSPDSLWALFDGMLSVVRPSAQRVGAYGRDRPRTMLLPSQWCSSTGYAMTG